MLPSGRTSELSIRTSSSKSAMAIGAADGSASGLRRAVGAGMLGRLSGEKDLLLLGTKKEGKTKEKRPSSIAGLCKSKMPYRHSRILDPAHEFLVGLRKNSDGLLIATLIDWTVKDGVRQG